MRAILHVEERSCFAGKFEASGLGRIYTLRYQTVSHANTFPLQSMLFPNRDMPSTATASMSSQLSGSTRASIDMGKLPPVPTCTTKVVYSNSNYDVEQRSYNGSTEEPWTCLRRKGCGNLSTGEQGISDASFNWSKLM